MIYQAYKDFLALNHNKTYHFSIKNRS